LLAANGGEKRESGWLWRVVAAGMEGVAAADSPDAAERSADGTMLLDGQDKIRTAARFEAAALAEEGAEGPLIESNHGNQQAAGDVPD
jgi:hypothetical protein